ncbi:MAG: hypothetical protein KAF41_06120 [Flavobacterium sp.]|jgi:hypothetical protein|uniref:DUF6520 family protein n=1 Tax=Flavobacterium lindanitolerans TaxID=428988 RepID=UPI000DB5305B|nr:DUF6520 family protein [Flavobacterium lindanitolerans]MBU7570212.1 hypothetical protein [Flavobacterium sp.]PZO27846.1 MAG: hypothetical protein DCE86_12785 [Flavobacteriaceae bacterium]THD34159.1 MAG: hypothetical protein DI588_03180 [Flavobacterium johnsoniae]
MKSISFKSLSSFVAILLAVTFAFANTKTESTLLDFVGYVFNINGCEETEVICSSFGDVRCTIGSQYLYKLSESGTFCIQYLYRKN